MEFVLTLSHYESKVLIPRLSEILGYVNTTREQKNRVGQGGVNIVSMNCSVLLVMEWNAEKYEDCR